MRDKRKTMIRETKNLKKLFIHYGEQLTRENFHPIKDRMSIINKPYGGLWSSPIDSKWGWKNWCESEDFRVDTLWRYTIFKLKPDTKILIIDSLLDFIHVWEKYSIPRRNDLITTWVLSFEKIQEDGYKGVYLTESGNSECHRTYFGTCDGDLNAWDCESMILFDLDCIEILEYTEEEKI
jgi:hypothetical protein